PRDLGEAPQRAAAHLLGEQLVDPAVVEEGHLVKRLGHAGRVGADARDSMGAGPPAQNPRCLRRRRAIAARTTSANSTPKANPAIWAAHATAPKAGPI